MPAIAAVHLRAATEHGPLTPAISAAPSGSPTARSRPLELDAESPGDQPQETQDFVGQVAISWLSSLERWVMIYGGDVSPMFGEASFPRRHRQSPTHPGNAPSIVDPWTTSDAATTNLYWFVST